ncbi:mannitol dehydrogenase family protein [Sphingomonas sp. AP4-R1]|uniref:mannitol dehydrogenase family protein n=1 Tax=Sphingomonas sp. AP4-R1 TaxID=2735134 RepID=UPI001598AD77|nr:mannitol dehydrogenase family protein [Sphingomonas sp. AP4-R1]QJU59775.1 mannitol dehydrogenase family protein [Sphingomonas sp. AP4-R1]
MNRLSIGHLADLPPAITTPRHALPTKTGIVHFGPGAFHRAHQASYVDTVLDQDPRWGIAAVSLRTRGTIAALEEQGGAYTIGIRDAEPGWRVIAAHNRFLAADDSAETLALLASPDVGLVSSTVTEKGYCLAPDGTLDANHPDIVHDLAGATPRSLIGWIVAGLAARRDAALAPFVPMPCDNLANNGAKLKAALVAFARLRDAELARWIEGEVRVPATMVDSITPASDAPFFAMAEAALGVRDDAAVQRESFVQWVIEDIGRPLGPDLGAAGATITSDVAGYENAKLRLLNGPHSTLAYAGLLRGHASVAEAMGDPELAAFVEAMMRQEIAAVLRQVPGLDLGGYISAVLARFRNPAIVHKLEQIAMDGSQKLPYRLVDTLIEARKRGMLPERICTALGCWIAFAMQRARAGTTIVDPLGTAIAAAASDGDGATVLARLTGQGILLPPEMAADSAVTGAIATAADAAFAGLWGSFSTLG